jgi:hypothetical protein
MESSIKNHINRQLHGNVKLHQPPVASTISCMLSHFTRLKSTISVEFGTLAQQSGNVVALYRDNVVAWQGSAMIVCESDNVVQDRQHRIAGYTRAYTRRRAGSCELEAASWKLRAGTSCKLQAGLEQAAYNASCKLRAVKQP